jgi:hypothetical protein
MKETPLPSLLRRRTMAILIPTAMLALGAAGCASPGIGTSEVAAPPAVTPQGADAKAILTAYRTYMQAYVKAYNTGDPNYSTFVQSGGGTGGGLQAVLQSSVSDGVIAKGNPALSDPVLQFVDANKTIASVSFCFDSTNWTTVNTVTKTPAAPRVTDDNSPHPRYPGDELRAPFRTLMLLDRDSSGNWTVQQTNAQPDNPC